MINLPQKFEDKMKELLKEEYPSYQKSFEEERLYGLRVNTKRISVEEFLKICPFSLEPIPWIENGFYYDGKKEFPAKHPFYHCGLYYLQEPSAMTPANRLPIDEGDCVLDLCAAPGGKATELGAKLNGSGILVTNDISNSRAKGLLKNIEIFGIENVLVLNEEPGRLVEKFPGYFDKILVDAPCSGEGMFRKDSKMVKAWEEHGPEYFSEIQKVIMRDAYEMLKPGGMILYSTCTFDPSENEEIISGLLEEHGDLELESISPGYEGFESGLDKEGKTIRIFPHKMKGEGHFLALLHKKGLKTEMNNRQKEKGIKFADEFLEFIQMLNISLPLEQIVNRKDKLYLLPAEIPDLKGLRFLRSGLFLGECKKKRFEPSQAFAMTLKEEDFKNTLNLSVSDERVMRYLRGETIEVKEKRKKGYCLILVEGFPLGWGKYSDHKIKNKYLPGWRATYA